MAVVLRVLVTIWALFFGMLAIRGLLDPQVYATQFSLPALVGGARNTVRADFSAFFLLSAAAALWGVWRRDASRVLTIPVLLFGGAFVARAVGVLMGDGLDMVVRTSMFAEAASVVLLLLAMRALAPRRFEPLGQALR